MTNVEKTRAYVEKARADVEKARAALKAVLDECVREYRAMYRNARIANWPDSADPDELMHWISEGVDVLIENLQNEIADKYNLQLKLTIWGRMGATIAPYGFSVPYYHHHFNDVLDIDRIYQDIWTDEDEPGEILEDLQHGLEVASRHLEAFKLINKRVTEAAASVAIRYKEEKQ